MTAAPRPGRARRHELGDLPYTELDDILSVPWPKVAIIPVGATEAHGPHLPLATDSFISDAVARRCSERLATLGYETVIFPTVDYAVTDWAAAFRGTVTIAKTTAHGLVLDAAIAATKMGFDRVVVVNSHLEASNVETLRAVATEYQTMTGRPLVFPDQTRRRLAERLPDEFRSGSCHAGRYETSLMMAIRPDLVRHGRMANLEPLHVALHEKLRDGVENFIDCGMDHAYCGDPAAATADEGRQTLDVLAEFAVEAVLGSLTDR